MDGVTTPAEVVLRFDALPPPYPCPDDHSVPICSDCHDSWHARMRERGLRL